MQLVKNIRRVLAIGCILILATACKGGSSVGPAYIRVLNVSPAYRSLDLSVSNTDRSGSQANVAYETASSYLSIAEDTYDVGLRVSGNAANLQTSSQKLYSDKHVTLIAYGSSGKFGTVQIGEDVQSSTVNSGYASVSLVDAAADAGALDVYITDASSALTDATPTSSSLSAGTNSGATSVQAGTYRIRVTAAGSKTDVRLDVSGVTLTSQEIVTIAVVGTTGGVLCNLVVLPQQGSPSVSNNPNARIRAAVGASGVTSMSVTIGTTPLVAAAPTSTVGSYKEVPAGISSVSLTADGTAVAAADESAEAGSDYTLLTWSTTAGIQTALIEDNNNKPTSGSANIRLVNLMSDLPDPIGLSVDFAPIVDGIALGSASTTTSISSSTSSEIDVTNSSTATYLFRQTSTSILDGAVYSVFMFGSASNATGIVRRDR